MCHMPTNPHSLYQHGHLFFLQFQFQVSQAERGSGSVLILHLMSPGIRFWQNFNVFGLPISVHVLPRIDTHSSSDHARPAASSSSLTYHFLTKRDHHTLITLPAWPASSAHLARPASHACLARPASPARLARPASPTRLVRPASTARQAWPASPAHLAWPASPAHLARPASPARLARPASPACPAQPASPTQPAFGDTVAQPGCPVHLHLLAQLSGICRLTHPKHR